jgi:hypothetical protein
MSYFIFLNEENVVNNLYRIAKDIADLDSLNLGVTSNYKIIEDSEINFNNVRLGTKQASTFSVDTIVYVDSNSLFRNKESLQTYINNYKDNISTFLKNNPNSTKYITWNNYITQLNQLNLDSITYPLAISLEQYFENNSQTSLSPLQLP